MRPIFGAGVRQITKSMGGGGDGRPRGSVGVAPSIYGGARSTFMCVAAAPAANPQGARRAGGALENVNRPRILLSAVAEIQL